MHQRDTRQRKVFDLAIGNRAQKKNYKKGNLFRDRIERFEKIGFTWDILEEQFEKGFQETLLYKESTGNPNAPQSYKTDEGYQLGTWQSKQRDNYRKGNSSPDRIERLEKIGFTWEKLEEQFEKGLQETLLYKNSTGNPNASQHYMTVEGFKLGSWQSHQRVNYRKGNLSPARVKRLEEIGFVWNVMNIEQNRLGWDQWYELTIRYMNEFGDASAPRSYKTSEGFRLGSWQSHQRKNYKKRKLSPDRIERLEKIGFTWEKLEEQFEKGLQETLLYKEKTGNPNVPQSYKTVEGYRLGSWQSDQRKSYKKGNLSPDRIKRLEDIGFKWRMQR